MSIWKGLVRRGTCRYGIYRTRVGVCCNVFCLYVIVFVFMCVLCVCACVRACVHACLCVCVGGDVCLRVDMDMSFCVMS